MTVGLDRRLEAGQRLAVAAQFEQGLAPADQRRDVGRFALDRTAEARDRSIGILARQIDIAEPGLRWMERASALSAASNSRSAARPLSACR